MPTPECIPSLLFPRLLVQQKRRAVVTGTIWLMVTAIGSTLALPAAAQSADLSNISTDVFSCMRRNTSGVGGSITYNGGNQGRIRVFATGLGQVAELSYSFNPGQQALNVAYVQGRAPFNLVLNGLNDTANRCRNGSYR